jgi:LAO/AO transport system kinase
VIRFSINLTRRSTTRQGIKKGIVEVSDLLLVTKADGSLLASATHTAADYKHAMQFLHSVTQHDEKPPQVLLVSASTGEGLPELWKCISNFRREMIASGKLQQQRQSQNRYWMWKHVQQLVEQRTQHNPRLRGLASELEEQLQNGSLTPRIAATRLLESITF